MEDNIPIKLDPGLISSTSFQDPFQIDPESLTLYNLITKVNHERPEEFLGLREEDLQNEILNEKIERRLQRQREENGDDSAKREIEKYVNMFQEPTLNEDTKEKVQQETKIHDDEEAIIDEYEEQETKPKVVLTEDNETEKMLLEKLSLEKEKLVQFHENKNELLKFIKASLNEASLSLDFVSLLVTSLRPNVGKTSMSPHLKQFIPLGSLNSDRIVPPEFVHGDTNGHGDSNGNTHGAVPTVSNTNNNGKLQSEQVNKKAMISWKLESLENTIKLINKKSKHLKLEIQREKNYFDNLNRISTVKCLNFVSNNKISKTDYKTYEEVLFKFNDSDIAIKYGYQDSGSRYKLNRGLAILEKSKANGELVFSPVTGSAGASRSHTSPMLESHVVVQIFEKVNDVVVLTSESTLFDAEEKQGEQNEQPGLNYAHIQQEIKKARNRIFEEEMFYQLIKEAKVLLSYGVKIISNNKILIELEDELIEISYVTMNVKDEGFAKKEDSPFVPALQKNAVDSDIEMQDSDSQANKEHTPNANENSLERDLRDLVKTNRKADYVVNFLRLMLCHFHKNNLYEGNSGTGPGTLPSGIAVAGSVTGTVPLLLRSLIGHINHEKFLKKLIKNLIDLYETELGYNVSFTKNDTQTVYKTKQSSFLNKEAIVTLSKNYGFSPADKNDVFSKITTPPKTLLRLKFVKETPKIANGVLKTHTDTTSGGLLTELIVKSSSAKSYCDCLINLRLYETSKNNEETLNVNYSDITDIRKCLKWVNSKFIAGTLN